MTQQQQKQQISKREVSGLKCERVGHPHLGEHRTSQWLWSRVPALLLPLTSLPHKAPHLLSTLPSLLCSLSIEKLCTMLKLRVLFYLAGIFRTSSFRGSISSDPERTIPGRPEWEGESRLYRRFSTKGR